MNLPLILSHPNAIKSADHYREQFLHTISTLGERAGQIQSGAETSTMLVASLGALDAALVNLLSYHAARKLDFDRAACLRMIGERLDDLAAAVALAGLDRTGGVQ